MIERKQTQKALPSPEQSNQSIINNLRTGIFRSISGEEGRFLEVNPGMERLLGYNREELLEMRITDLYVYPQDRRKLLDETIQSTDGVAKAITMKRKDGTKVLVLCTIVAVKSEAGGVKYFDGVLEDYSKLNKTQEALQKSVNQLRTVFDKLDEGLIVSDTEGQLLFWNRAAIKMHEFKSPWQPNRRGHPLRDDFILEDKEGNALPVSRWPLSRVLQGESLEACEVNLRRVKSDWSRVWEYGGRLISSVDGVPPFALLTVKDVTRRKRAESALHDSEEFSSILLEGCPHPILVLNPDTSVRYVNAAFRKMTGYSSTDILGMIAPHPWWRDESYFNNAEIRERTLRIRSRRSRALLTKKNGQSCWVKLVYRSVSSQGRLRYRICYFTDITEETRNRENMECYIDEITKAQEDERKRIARDLHDEPLQNLASVYMEMQNYARVHHSLESTKETIEQWKATIGSTLDDVRRFVYELRPGLLDRLGLQESLEFLVEELEHDVGIRCRLSVLGHVLKIAPETNVMLFRIVQEALRNIRKHSRATAVEIGVLFRARSVKITIKDNGIGFRQPDVITDLARIRKLGLIGISERVRLLNGELLIDSDVGKGTTLTVEIPFPSQTHRQSLAHIRAK